MTAQDVKLNRQVAPYPDALAGLVDRLRYRPHLGWRVKLEDDCQRDKPGRHSGESRGLTLVVIRYGPDTYNPGRMMRVAHYFAVPPATYNTASWMRWLFDRLGNVDDHERMEDYAFAIADGHDGPAGVQPPERLTRPYAPNHGPGWDPYLITVERAGADRRMSYRGVLDDDGTGHGIHQAVIGAALAAKLAEHPGKWVKFHPPSQELVAVADTVTEAAEAGPGLGSAAGCCVMRVPENPGGRG